MQQGIGVWILTVGAFFYGGCATNRSEGSGESAKEQEMPPRSMESVRPEMIGMRDAFRKTVVVMWHEDSVPEARRAQVLPTGQYLYETNRLRIEQLVSLLGAELAGAARDDFRSLPMLSEFLDVLESDASWWDADKLVFKEAVDELQDVLSAQAPVSPRGKALQTRLSEDVAALDGIEKLYEKELAKVFARLDTRGMAVKRQKWDAYLAHLTSLYRAEEILDEIAPGVMPEAPTGTRGKQGGESKVMYGNELPDKTFILTFDDGPHGKNTPRILDLLKQYRVQAIFFEVGRSIGKLSETREAVLRSRAEASRRAVEEGHILANHTVNHPVLPRLKDAEIQQELLDNKALLGRVGQPAVTLFRPPYGAMGDRVRLLVEKERMTPVLWNIDSKDWADPVPRSIANRVISQARKRGRGIILFHDIHVRTADALALVLDTLTKEGYRFATHDGTRLIAPMEDEPLNPEGVASAFYRKSHAVIIGINDYDKWPKLSYAVHDAESMRDLLTRTFQFEKENVHLLLNKAATRKAILELLGDTLTSSETVHPDDRIFVFFAGHGATRALPSGKNLGYIIPVDADPEHLQSQAISMSVFQDINEAMPAKHVFYIMDACYGGQALVRGGTTVNPLSQKYLKEVTRRMTRQMLTAGGADEQVSDNGPSGHSIFTWTVLEGLRGKADLNGDLHISASELFAHVGPVVSSLSHQTPSFGSLVGSKGGEFIFELKHDDEFLSQMSAQLDDEAIALNRQIEDARKALAQKLSENDALKKELAAVNTQLSDLGQRSLSPAEENLDKTPAAYRRDGMALFRERRYEEAAAVFKKAFEKNPESALTANNIGFAYYMMGQFDTALSWYTKTVSLDPDRSVVYINLGEVYEELGDTEKARTSYEKFLALAPDHKLSANVSRRVERLTGK